MKKFAEIPNLLPRKPWGYSLNVEEEPHRPISLEDLASMFRMKPKNLLKWDKRHNFPFAFMQTDQGQMTDTERVSRYLLSGMTPQAREMVYRGIEAKKQWMRGN